MYATMYVMYIIYNIILIFF